MNAPPIRHPQRSRQRRDRLQRFNRVEDGVPERAETLIRDHFFAGFVGQIEGIDGGAFLRGNPRERDLKVEAADGIQYHMQQPESVGCLEVDNRVGWVRTRIDDDSRWKLDLVGELEATFGERFLQDCLEIKRLHIERKLQRFRRFRDTFRIGHRLQIGIADPENVEYQAIASGESVCP